MCNNIYGIKLILGNNIYIIYYAVRKIGVQIRPYALELTEN